MQPSTSSANVIFFDTTMRDGEMMLKTKMTLPQKLHLTKLLEAMRVDVIEVGYPGVFRKDFDELFMISKQIKQSVICGLSSSKPDEIASLALAIKPAIRGRIHLYTPVNLRQTGFSEQQTLEIIHDSVALARHYCPDVEWSAFDAPRSHPDFLCRAIELAIASGATTIGIPDSLGNSTPDTFSALIRSVMNRVPNIEQATIAVHCHDDQGFAVANSIAALDQGARQIECSINGLGARRGNANLAEVVRALQNHSPTYSTPVDPSLLEAAAELVTQFVQPAPLLKSK